jgi:hypothetical protein
MRRSILKISLLLALSGMATFLLAQNNPFIGKWEMNTAKSKFNPPPAPKNETVTVGEETTTVEGVDGAGNSYKWSYKVTPGKETPIDGRENSTVVEKLSGNTVDHVWTSGKYKSNGHGVLSKDGKTMRYTNKGMDSQGRPINDLYIFERQ